MRRVLRIPCKNNKVVIHAHCQRCFGWWASSFCFCCPQERCTSAQIHVQGYEVHLSSAQRQEQFASLAWEQSLVASRCHLLGHAWPLYIECAHGKFQVSQLNYRREVWFLLTFFSVFRPAMVFILCSRSLDCISVSPGDI